MRSKASARLRRTAVAAWIYKRLFHRCCASRIRTKRRGPIRRSCCGPSRRVSATVHGLLGSENSRLRLTRTALRVFAHHSASCFSRPKYFDATTKEQGQGDSLDAGGEHVFSKLWEKTRTPERTFKFRLQQADGKPVAADVIIEASWDLDDCSTPEKPLGTTNSAGELSARFSVDDAVAIFIDSNDDTKKYLTADEFAQLVRSGEITLIWPRKPK